MRARAGRVELNNVCDCLVSYMSYLRVGTLLNLIAFLIQSLRQYVMNIFLTVTNLSDTFPCQWPSRTTVGWSALIDCMF